MFFDSDGVDDFFSDPFSSLIPDELCIFDSPQVKYQYPLNSSSGQILNCVDSVSFNNNFYNSNGYNCTYDSNSPPFSSPSSVSSPSSSPSVVDDRPSKKRKLSNEKFDVLLDEEMQRVFVKNCESAQAYKHRKKSKFNELERKVKELTQENQNLRDNLANMAKDNEKLKQEVMLLQSAVAQKGMNTLVTRGTTLLTGLGKQKQKKHSTGLVLLVVLFSFGLMFNNIDVPHPKTLKASIVDHSATFKREEDMAHKIASPSQDLSVLPNRAIQKSELPCKVEIPVIKLEDVPDRSLNNLSEKISLPPNVETSTSNGNSLKESQIVHEMTKVTNPDLTTVMPQIPLWKSNTTYIMTQKLQQLVPPRNAQIQFTQELPEISFLIPPDDDALNKNKHNFLEMRCNVVSVGKLNAMIVNNV